ncbi:hypothetical protein GCM10028812_06550 [Ancylobacter sonchi]
MCAQHRSDFGAPHAQRREIGRQLIEVPQRADPHRGRQFGYNKNYLRKADCPRELGFQSLLFPAQSERPPMRGSPSFPCKDGGIYFAVVLRRGRS